MRPQCLEGMGPCVAEPTPLVEDRLGCTDCERMRTGPIAQPVNTLTSLAFLAAAGVVASRGMRRGSHRIECLAFAGVLGLVGAGSVAFHGPQPRGAKAMHDWPIAALLAFTFVTPVARRLGGRSPLPGWSGRRGAALAGTTVAAALAYAGGRTSAPTCDPDSPLQLHGLWHVLAAAGFTQAAAMLFEESDGD